MNFSASIFKSYDVRGHYPDEVNPQVFNWLAQEMALHFQPKAVSLGRDNRLSSSKLALAMIDGFLKQGVDVIDLGMITSDMIYFAAGKYNFDLNVVVTGSHAEEENGFKICQKGAVAVTGDHLLEIKNKLSQRSFFPAGQKTGQKTSKNILQDWVKHALSFVDATKIKPFKIVFDTGNGMAGVALEKVEKQLPGKFINLFFELDGRFPNHFPNPLIEKNLKDIQQKILVEKADFGVAFDADGDRAFFLDEKGAVVTGSVLTAMIAQNLLQKNKGETILYNAVCGRIVPETIKKYGGRGIRVKVGHSLIKEKMREESAIFAGEHSGHFYFRDNWFADSGLIAVLTTLELISQKPGPLSKIVQEFQKYSQSGEINFEIDDKEGTMKKIEAQYKDKADTIDWLDGLSVWFKDWWFNVRPSGTEPLLRLNVEANNDRLLDQKTELLKNDLAALGAKLDQ